MLVDLLLAIIALIPWIFGKQHPESTAGKISSWTALEPASSTSVAVEALPSGLLRPSQES
jgi:hypothetical protein